MQILICHYCFSMQSLHKRVKHKWNRIHLPKLSRCTFSIFGWGQKQGCRMSVSERGTNIWLGGVVSDLKEVYKPSVASQRPVVLSGLPQDDAVGDAQGQIRIKKKEKSLRRQTDAPLYLRHAQL